MPFQDSPPKPIDAPRRRPLSRRRRWGFRCAAIVLGLSPLLLFELALWLAGWDGASTADTDPFLQVAFNRPLFERQGDRWAVAASRQEWFRPESFAAAKGSREFRIFVLGGSTVQGRPYAIETAFSSWLELSLQAAAPSRNWEVVNCGGVSYASYRLTPLLEEVLGHEPDLIVLYTGHNEFLEERTYEHLRDRPRIVSRAHHLLDRTRAFRFVRHWWDRASVASPPPPTLVGDVDAILDYRGGLEQYRRDDAWQRGVAEHYAFNVERMATLAARAGVPMILCNPVSNLSASPPFKSAPSLPPEAPEAGEFDDLCALAAPRGGASLERRVAWLERAVQLDPRHAGAQYQLAQCLLAVGRVGEAREHFLRAKDEDVCPLRMREPMHAALAEIARRRRLPLLDVREIIERRSDHLLPGKKWLVDHVHPSIHGHQVIAGELLQLMAREGIVKLEVVGAEFEAARQDAYRRHLNSLDPIYYEVGKRRLEGLRRWSEGRAFKVK